ncbi:kinetochore complex Sim4 subunit Fta1-domain-containing protein [Aspergillus floccosus]
MAAANPQQLLNSSWTLHRLSPLHHEKEFHTLLDNPAALKAYAARLRDQITGNAFAGLQGAGTGTDDDSLSRTGALTNCTWEMMPTLSLLGPEQPPVSTPDDYLKRSSGILVVLEYENAVYKAALLAPPEDESGARRETRATSATTYLPLLLTRFPNPLRQTLITFLAANFDTYCSVLRLPSHIMCACLETYVSHLSSTHDETVIQNVVKELQLTLGFSPSVAPALRTLNLNIPRASLASFVRPENPSGAVLSGLSAYLAKHLAMDLDFSTAPVSRNTPAGEHVRLTKIACGGFVLASEGRLKLITHARSQRPTTDQPADSDADAQTESDRLALQASEALLHAVLRRAVSNDVEAT